MLLIVVLFRYMSDWFGTYFTQNIKSTTPVWATHESGHEEVVVLTLASHPTIPLLRYVFVASYFYFILFYAIMEILHLYLY